jgi:hypothetical protein
MQSADVCARDMERPALDRDGAQNAEGADRNGHDNDHNRTPIALVGMLNLFDLHEDFVG